MFAVATAERFAIQLRRSRAVVLAALCLVGCSSSPRAGAPAQSDAGASADGGSLSISGLAAVETPGSVLAYDVS